MPCVRPVQGGTADRPRLARAEGGAPRAVRGVRRAWERGAARLAGGVGVLLCLLPAWALACPTCVERAPESSSRTALLLGAILLVPFLLVALGVWAAVRVARGDAKRSA